MARRDEDRAQEPAQESRQKPAWLLRALNNRLGKRPHRTGFNLSDEAMRRLRSAKAYDGVDFSCIVDALICTHVVGYRLQWSASKDESRDEAA